MRILSALAGLLPIAGPAFAAEEWGRANPDKPAGQWFRHDARILAKIERTGKLGIPGLELKE